MRLNLNNFSFGAEGYRRHLIENVRRLTTKAAQFFLRLCPTQTAISGMYLEKKKSHDSHYSFKEKIIQCIRKITILSKMLEIMLISLTNYDAIQCRMGLILSDNLLSCPGIQSTLSHYSFNVQPLNKFKIRTRKYFR